MTWSFYTYCSQFTTVNILKSRTKYFVDNTNKLSRMIYNTLICFTPEQSVTNVTDTVCTQKLRKEIKKRGPISPRWGKTRTTCRRCCSSGNKLAGKVCSLTSKMLSRAVDVTKLICLCRSLTLSWRCPFSNYIAQ